MAVLSLDPVINIRVNLATRAVVRNHFGTALLLGEHDVFTDRIKTFYSAAEVLDAGFIESDPIYLAAKTYFAQHTAPGKLIIGTKDPDESFEKAVADCRAESYDWYAVVPLGISSEEAVETAALVESLKPFTIMGVTTEDPELSRRIKCRRTMVQISSTPYAAIGPIGWAAGANTGLADGAYTLDSKDFPGIPTDDFEESEVEAAKKNRANVYVNRGLTYDVFEPGVMSDGTWFDEVVNLDMLVTDMQTNAMNLKKQLRKLAQTEGGMNQIKAVLMEAGEKARIWGALDGGIWKGGDVLHLHYGDALPRGYLIQWVPVNEQPQAEREERISPAIYLSCKMKGANHCLTMQVDVNR